MKRAVFLLGCVLATIGAPMAPLARVEAGMIRVEGGEFLMGDVFGDGDENERPPHRVVLDTYYIGKCEVTVGEFDQFVKATGYVTSADSGNGALVFDELVGRQVLKSQATWRNPFHEQGSRHPVVCVSWYDAIAFCNWKSEAEGLTPCYSGEVGDIACDFDADGYRLPTEAEWEYAARSRGKQLRYAWGSDQPIVGGKAAANVKDAAFRNRFPRAKDAWPGGYDDGEVFTAPVGRYVPNELGLHDMTGNVYEWCWDWMHDDYYANSPTDNPRGPETGSVRACRDAGFGCPISALRIMSRGYAKPVYRAEHVGFRLVRSGTARDGVGQNPTNEPLHLTGPYLGQAPPGVTPELFAHDILPLDGIDHCFPAFGPGGNELFWMRVDLGGEKPRGEIWTMREIDGGWQPPHVAPFSGTHNDHAPIFAGYGRRLYFASDRPVGGDNCKRIWYVERAGTGWGEPVPLGQPPHAQFCATQPSFTDDGAMYFAGRYDQGEWGIGIFRSRFVNGEYGTPGLLGPHINTPHADAYPFVDPGGRYLLFASSRPGAASTETDLYISVRGNSGEFEAPTRLGPDINNGLTVSFSCVSLDGRYLFFNRFDGDGENSTDRFYWVDAAILAPYLPTEDGE